MGGPGCQWRRGGGSSGPASEEAEMGRYKGVCGPGSWWFGCTIMVDDAREVAGIAETKLLSFAGAPLDVKP